MKNGKARFLLSGFTLGENPTIHAKQVFTMPTRPSRRALDAKAQSRNKRDVSNPVEKAEEVEEADGPAISPYVMYFLMFVLLGRCVTSHEENLIL